MWRCRRPLTQVRIFRERMKRASGLPCWRSTLGTANPAVRTELENYLREWPNDPVALVRLAEIQQRDGAVDQAVKTYEKVIADNPHYAPATRQLALLYGQLSTDSRKLTSWSRRPGKPIRMIRTSPKRLAF